MTNCSCIPINCKDFNFNIEEKENNIIIHISSEDSEKMGKVKEMIDKCKTITSESCCEDSDVKNKSKGCC